MNTHRSGGVFRPGFSLVISLAFLLAGGCGESAQPAPGDGDDSDDSPSGGGAPGSGGGPTGGAIGTGGVGTGGVTASTGGSGTGGAPDGSGGGSGGAPIGTGTTYMAVGMGNAGRIALYEVNTSSLALTETEALTVGVVNSYGAFSADGKHLFVADEGGKILRSYDVDLAAGALTFRNEIPTTGGPVYVSVDNAGTHVLLAYYNQGQVEVFSVGADGTLGARTDLESTGTQAHSIVLSPAGDFALVPNKGSNTVSQFVYDQASGQLTANNPPTIARAGGPRHLTFSVDGARAYVVNELASTVSAFSYNSLAGTLTDLETESNVADGFSGNLSGADIHVEAGGKFLFSTNRADGDSTIKSFSLTGGTALEALSITSTLGSKPRNFAVHPSGSFLFVANQDSNTLVPFRVGTDGGLTAGAPVTVASQPFWIGFFIAP